MSSKRGDRRSSRQIAAEKRERTNARGISVLAEIAAQNARVQANTVRLKELRLAKEAAERAAPVVASIPAKAAKKNILLES